MKNTMKDIFLHGAIDLVLFTLFLSSLFTHTQIFSLNWLINQLYMIFVIGFFLYDIYWFGDKIEKYINKNENEKSAIQNNMEN